MTVWPLYGQVSSPTRGMRIEIDSYHDDYLKGVVIPHTGDAD